MDCRRTERETFLENSFLLENIQGGIVYSDFEPPFRLRYATEGMARLCGYTIYEIMDLVQMDIVHEDDKAALEAGVANQFAQGDTFAVEYRLKKKDGTYVYVLDRAKVVQHEDGKKYIHCLLTDISDLKEMENALKLNQEKYKIAIQQSGNVIIEFNINTEELSFSENYKLLFGCEAPKGTLNEIISAGWVDTTYGKRIKELFQQVLDTSVTSSMELVIHTSLERDIWCSLYLIPVINNGHLYSIVGCLENIDEEKHTIEHLTELSLTDSLTGVYNRYAVEQFVKEKIANSNETEISALLILDIDYFKMINDTKGHDFGDEVLIKLSKIVKSLLPKHSVFGRLGGDEFLIFLTLEKENANLDEIAKRIVDGVRTRFGTGGTPVTISMGATWHTKQQEGFKELYKKADVALYETKANSRNGYTIYNG